MRTQEVAFGLTGLVAGAIVFYLVSRLFAVPPPKVEPVLRAPGVQSPVRFVGGSIKADASGAGGWKACSYGNAPAYCEVTSTAIANIWSTISMEGVTFPSALANALLYITWTGATPPMSIVINARDATGAANGGKYLKVWPSDVSGSLSATGKYVAMAPTGATLLNDFPDTKKNTDFRYRDDAAGDYSEHIFQITITDAAGIAKTYGCPDGHCTIYVGAP
jgi:hypothetical protein